MGSRCARKKTSKQMTDNAATTGQRTCKKGKSWQIECDNLSAICYRYVMVVIIRSVFDLAVEVFSVLPRSLDLSTVFHAGAVAFREPVAITGLGKQVQLERKPCCGISWTKPYGSHPDCRLRSV